MKHLHLMPKRFLLFCALGVIVLAACNAGASTKPPSSATSTPTAQPAPTSSATPAITATASATETEPVSDATPWPDLSPAKPFAILGKGLAGEVVRSPDGRLIAVLEGKETENPTLRWLDAASGEELGTADPGSYSWSNIEGFSSDGRWLVASKQSFQVYDMDWESATSIINTSTGEIRECDCARGIRFSADQRYISCVNDGSRYSEYSVTPIRFSFASVFPLEPEDTFQAPDYTVLYPENPNNMSAPAISPDNRLLAAGYHDNSNYLLYLWDFKTGAEQFSIPHIAQINSVDFSPDGRYVASGGEDGVLRLFATTSGILERVVTGFADSITRIRFSTDGNQITVSINEQPDQVYDLTSGQIEPADGTAVSLDPFLAARYLEGYADGSSVLFSPNGKTLAMGRQNVQLWDIESQSVIVSLDNPYGPLLAWAFNSDGSQLAGMTKSGDVLVWDTADGALILARTSDRMDAGPNYMDSVDVVYGLAFSPDNGQIAFCNSGAAEIWDIATATLVKRLELATRSYVTQVSFSADGKRLYAITGHYSDDLLIWDAIDSAQIWDIDKGQLLKQFALPIENQANMAAALKGSLLARSYSSPSGSYQIELWNLESGEMLALPVSDGWDTQSLRFSPDGGLLIAKIQSNLYFWKTTTGTLLDWMPIEAASYGSDLAISPDSDTLAIGQSGQFQLWDINAIRNAAAQTDFIAVVPPTAFPTPEDTWVETPAPTQAVTVPETSSLPEGAISPANAAQMQVIAQLGRGALKEVLWSNTPTATLLTGDAQGVSIFGGSPLSEIAHLPMTSEVESIVQLANGQILAAGVADKHIQVWNLSANTLLGEFPDDLPVQISSQGDLLVYGNGNGALQTYDLAAGQPLARLYGGSQYTTIKLPTISPNGKLVAAVIRDRYVRIWESRTGKIVNAVGGVDAAITALSFSADGQFVVGAAGGTAWVWDIRPEITRPYRIKQYSGSSQVNPITSEVDPSLIAYEQFVTTAALSPDNRLLAVGDSERSIWLYEINTNNLLAHLEGHAAPLQQVRFNPAGTRLLSVDSDNQIIFWDVASGKAIESLSTHSGPIRGLILGLDGNLRAWGSNTAWMLRPDDGTLLQTTSIYSGTILAASPKGDWLAVSSGMQMSLWDAKTGAFGQILEGAAAAEGEFIVDSMLVGKVFPGFYAANFSLDGTQLTTQAAGTPGRIYAQQADGTYQLQEETEWGGAAWMTIYDRVERSAISPDGQWRIVTEQWSGNVTGDAQIILQDSAKQEINRLGFSSGGHYFYDESQITALAFSPDNRLIAVGMWDGSIAIVDVANWQVIATFNGHIGPVNAIAFSGDGKTMATAGEDGLVKLWAVRDEP
ncbi:MAG: hypothetical protein ACOYYS_27045 [Chloroflexota bacterium]